MIDRVFFINLANRHDRREHITKQLSKLFSLDKIQRIDAVRHENGAVGCSTSHIIALEEGIRQGCDSFAVFEDDFVFYDARRVLRDLVVWDRYGCAWDVLLLSGNAVVSERFCAVADRVLSSQTTAGYIVSKGYAPVLLENFKEGLTFLRRHGTPSTHALDMYWKRLQPVGRWFILRARPGKQEPSYSDIERRFVDYGC